VNKLGEFERSLSITMGGTTLVSWGLIVNLLLPEELKTFFLWPGLLTIVGCFLIMACHKSKNIDDINAVFYLAASVCFGFVVAYSYAVAVVNNTWDRIGYVIFSEAIVLIGTALIINGLEMES